MYNGIGLPTARGSGTNAYVQQNLSYRKPIKKLISKNDEAADLPPVRPINPEILDHVNRRKVEVQCVELKERLESENTLSKEEIEQQVTSLREGLLQKLTNSKRSLATLQENEFRELPDQKVQEIEKMRTAFKISSTHETNSFFRRDRDTGKSESTYKAESLKKIKNK